jgi:hypothetical protein
MVIDLLTVCSSLTLAGCEKTALKTEFNISVPNKLYPYADPCLNEMMKVGMPMVDGLYFEQHEFGSHNCQVRSTPSTTSAVNVF